MVKSGAMSFLIMKISLVRIFYQDFLKLLGLLHAYCLLYLNNNINVFLCVIVPL